MKIWSNEKLGIIWKLEQLLNMCLVDYDILSEATDPENSVWNQCMFSGVRHGIYGLMNSYSVYKVEMPPWGLGLGHPEGSHD